MTPRLRFISACLLALPLAAQADVTQVDRFFAIRTLEAPDQPEVIVRISETARAKAFVQAMHGGHPVRLTSRLVQRPSAWSPAWPFYTERHRLLPIDKLVARCATLTPGELSRRIARGARIQGNAWCPAVKVVREIKP